MPVPFLLITAPAKVNLYLGVHTQKGERGYHQVDSVMTTIDLADTLAITRTRSLWYARSPRLIFHGGEHGLSCCGWLWARHLAASPILPF